MQNHDKNATYTVREIGCQSTLQGTIRFAMNLNKAGEFYPGR